MRTRTTLVLLIGLCISAFAQDARPSEPVRKDAAGSKRQQAPSTLKLLNQKIPEVSFEDLPLDQAIEWIKEYTGMQIQVRWQTLEDAGVEREKSISLRVKNLTLAQVLWMLMNEAGGPDLKLAYRATGTLLILSTAEDLGQEMLVRVYPVEDLLVRVPRFPGPHVDLQRQQGGGVGGGSGGQNIFGGNGSGSQQNDNEDQQGQQNQGVQADPEIQRLIELIQQTIQPNTWLVNGGTGTIQAFRRTLVVRNNIRVHQELGGAVRDAER